MPFNRTFFMKMFLNRRLTTTSPPPPPPPPPPPQESVNLEFKDYAYLATYAGLVVSLVGFFTSPSKADMRALRILAERRLKRDYIEIYGGDLEEMKKESFKLEAKQKMLDDEKSKMEKEKTQNLQEKAKLAEDMKKLQNMKRTAEQREKKTN